LRLSFPASSVGFPDRLTYGEAFFREAARHCWDAKILFDNGSYAGCVSACLKGVELGTKTLAILDGGVGWWRKVHESHEPMTAVKTHPLLKGRFDALESHRVGLPAEVMVLERLNPGKPGSGDIQELDQANPEYPFVFVEGSPPHATLTLPSLYFTMDLTKRRFNLTVELLAAIASVEAQVGSWNVALPPQV